MNTFSRLPFAVALVPAALVVNLVVGACSGGERTSGAQAVTGAGGMSASSGFPIGSGGGCGCTAPKVISVECMNTSPNQGQAFLNMTGKTIDEMARIQIVAKFIAPQQANGVMYGYEPPLTKVLFDDGRITVDCADEGGMPSLLYKSVLFIVP